jgi:hypothetical protein
MRCITDKLTRRAGLVRPTSITESVVTPAAGLFAPRQRGRAVTVGGAVARPAAGSARPGRRAREPDVRVSPHPAPQYTSLCHRHAIGGDYSPPELGTCVLRGGLASGPQSVVYSSHTPSAQDPASSCTRALSYTDPTACPERSRRVSLSPALPVAFASWGILAIGAYGWLPAPAIRRAAAGFPRSVCPFSATTEPVLSGAKERYSTPCPAHRAETT